MPTRRVSSWTAVTMLSAVTIGTAAWSISTAPTLVPRQAVESPTFPAVSAEPTSVPVITVPASPSPVDTSSTAPAAPVPSYHPSYDTISALAHDSQAVFIGTVQPFFEDPSNGGTSAPLAVDHLLEGVIPRLEPEPELPQGQPGDLPVVLGRSYLVFWSEGTTGETSCAVGGARGLFDYDPATKTATRTSTDPSQIPEELSLSDVIAQLPRSQPVGPEVPVCAPSVTGG